MANKFRIRGGKVHENRWGLPLRLYRLRSRSRSGQSADLPLHRLPDAVRLGVPDRRVHESRELQPPFGRTRDLREDRREWKQAAAVGLPKMRHADLFGLTRQ